MPDVDTPPPLPFPALLPEYRTGNRDQDFVVTSALVAFLVSGRVCTTGEGRFPSFPFSLTLRGCAPRNPEQGSGIHYRKGRASALSVHGIGGPICRVLLHGARFFVPKDGGSQPSPFFSEGSDGSIVKGLVTEKRILVERKYQHRGY